MSSSSSSTHIIRACLLFVPLAAITWWFFGVEMGGSSSIGGGGYNLAELFYPVWMLGYCAVYVLGTLAAWGIHTKRKVTTKADGAWMLIGIIMGGAVLVYAVATIH